MSWDIVQPPYLGLIRPRFGLKPGAARIFGGNCKHLRVIKGDKVPPIMKEGIAYAESCRSDITRTMHPERICWIGYQCPDVDVKVRAV